MEHINYVEQAQPRPTEQLNKPPLPRKKTFYYRNSHGKVVSLSEDVAFEQHRAHPKYLGNSEDLGVLGFSVNEAIGMLLEQHEARIAKEPPIDQRKEIRDTKGGITYGGKEALKGGQKPQSIDIGAALQQYIQQNPEQVQQMINNAQPPAPPAQAPKQDGSANK